MRARGPVIPAVLAANQTVFQKRLDFATKTADAVHLDVIDNDFCLGEALSIDKWPKITAEYSEAHLMVRRPAEYIEKLSQKSITRAIVHIESTFKLADLVQKARQHNVLLGFAVNPDTDLEKLRDYYPVSTYIQVMGIHPGRSGQMMIETTPLAINYLSKNQTYRLTISVDGGVSVRLLPKLFEAGVTYVVSTHEIFESNDWQQSYEHMLETIKDVKQGTLTQG